MSSIDEDDYEDELYESSAQEAEEAAAEQAAVETVPNNTVIRRRKNEPPIEYYAQSKKVNDLLKDENVSEVHVSYKRSGLTRQRQPYVCIIYNNGSSIERPLADIIANERPLCPTPTGQRRRQEIEPYQEEEPRKWFQWGKGRPDRDGLMKHHSGDVQKYVDNDGCTVVVKREMTLIRRKSCGDDRNQNHGRRSLFGRRHCNCGHKHDHYHY